MLEEGPQLYPDIGPDGVQQTFRIRGQLLRLLQRRSEPSVAVEPAQPLLRDVLDPVDTPILADSEEEMLRYRDILTGMIESRGLEMNPDKEVFFQPGQSFEFLGFRISAAGIDISANSVRKMKGKIRRSTRSIRRWILRKDAPVGETIKALIREYNRRFYGYEIGELSWSAWYFPAITTTDSLHEIDLYLQDWLRYVATGRHNKRNYDEVPYDMMRDRGYRPLVSEYVFLDQRVGGP